MSAVRGVVSLRRGKNVAASMRLIIRDDDREGEGEEERSTRRDRSRRERFYLCVFFSTRPRPFLIVRGDNVT